MDDQETSELPVIIEEVTPEQAISENRGDVSKITNIKYSRNHPLENIIDDVNDRVRTRSHFRNIAEQDHLAFISQLGPKNLEEALSDNSWIEVMHDELHQFERNNAWSLVSKRDNQSTIGTRWIFWNKLSEEGKIIKNKARLVAREYNQEFGLNFEESFAPVARLEAVKILLAFACSYKFKLF